MSLSKKAPTWELIWNDVGSARTLDHITPVVANTKSEARSLFKKQLKEPGASLTGVTIRKVGSPS